MTLLGTNGLGKLTVIAIKILKDKEMKEPKLENTQHGIIPPLPNEYKHIVPVSRNYK